MAIVKRKRLKRKRTLVLLIYISVIQFLLVIGYLNLKVKYSVFSSHKPYVINASNSILTFSKHSIDFLFRVFDVNKKPKLCLSPYILPVDEELQVILRKGNMLHYFKNASKYMVSVPEWQLKLNHEIQANRIYFLTAVLRMRVYAEDKAKWTIKELKQWLHYQFWAGVEHVYICNHYLNDSERLDVHLLKYVKLNLVTIYPWNHVVAIPGEKNYHHAIMNNQVKCYTHVVNLHGHETIWQYSLDMDESPFVVGDSCEGFLPRYLRTLDASVDQVVLENFVLQGQGDRSRDLTCERITRISPKPYNKLRKPIYKASRVTKEGIHSFQVIGKTIKADPDELKMLHYWGARGLNWGNDTKEMYDSTVEFQDVRRTIAINIRHSLIAFQEFDAFSATTGP